MRNASSSDRVRAALVIAAVVIAAWPTLAFGLEVVVERDFGAQSYPIAHYLRSRLLAGGLPHWNPLSSSGIPFLAQGSTLALYPGSLVYVALPMPWSLHAFVLGHVWLAGFGMHALARRLVGPGAPALLAGVAFALEGYVVNAMMWPHTIAAIAWLPIVVLAAMRAVREGGRAWALAAALAGVQWLTGAAEVVALGWLVVALATLFVLATEREARAARALRALGLAVTAPLLAAAQLAPFAELVAESSRSTTFGSGSDGPMPPWGVASFFLPLFRTYRAPNGLHYQHGQDFTTSYYFGAGVLALALVALTTNACAKRREARALAALALVGVVLAMGDATPAYGLVRALVPAFGAMRFVVKLVLLAGLAAPLLAALGADAIARGLSCEDAARTRRLIALIFGAVAAVVVALAAWDALAPMPSRAGGAVAWNAALRVLGLAALAGTLAVRPRSPRLAAAMPYVAVLAVAVDLCTHTPGQLSMADPAVYDEGLATQTMGAPPKLGDGRAMLDPAADEKLTRMMVGDPARDFLAHRIAAFADTNLVDEVPTVDGFYPLHLAREQKLWLGVVRSGSAAARDRLARFLGVSITSSPRALLDWVAAERPAPIVTIGEEPVVIADAEAIPRHFLFDAELDPARTVLLDASATDSCVRDPHVASPAARIVATSFTAERVEVDYASPAATMLVVAQAWYPAWRARIDGATAPVLAANHAFQAVPVPAGAHHVSLVYDDVAFRRGLAVSALAWLAVVGVVAKSRRKNDRPPDLG